MKKSVLFSVLALTASAFADGDFIAAAQKMNGQQKMDNQQPAMNAVVLTSARPESDNGWYVFADALYWHADVGNTDWAVKSTTTSTGTTDHVHNLDFKWSWGFKAGIGVNMNHDMWDSNLCYTWFHTENSNAIGREETLPVGVSENVNVFSPAFIKSGGATASAKQEWSIHFSMFDWELGRAYYVGKSLAVRPHVGVKGGWINQDRKTRLTETEVTPGVAGAVTTAHLENNFWGVGPSVGVNTMWVLGNAGSNMDHRFSLFGDVAGALMYGHFDNSYNIKTETTSERVKGLDRNLAATMLQAMMGLSWDTAFNRGRNHFMMKVGYEFQYWFRQNQFLALDSIGGSAFSGPIRYSDDLSLQGVTAEFRFDF